MKSLTNAAIAAVLILGASYGSAAGAATLGTSALTSPAIIAVSKKAPPSSSPDVSGDIVQQLFDFITDSSNTDTSTDSGE
jgi:hypothetical protein